MSELKVTPMELVKYCFHQSLHFYSLTLVCLLIGKITREDIQRVARRMLRSFPSVAALGNLSKLPSYEDIQTALSSRDGRFPHRLSLFR